MLDGFTGNVLLKFYETIAPMLIGRVSKIAGVDAQRVIAELKELDADEHGGAPLPIPVKMAMRFAADVMRQTASRI